MWITTRDLTVMHIKSCIFHTVSMVTTSGLMMLLSKNGPARCKSFHFSLRDWRMHRLHVRGHQNLRFQIIYRVIKSQIYKMIFPTVSSRRSIAKKT